MLRYSLLSLLLLTGCVNSASLPSALCPEGSCDDNPGRPQGESPRTFGDADDLDEPGVTDDLPTENDDTQADQAEGSAGSMDPAEGSGMDEPDESDPFDFDPTIPDPDDFVPPDIELPDYVDPVRPYTPQTDPFGRPVTGFGALSNPFFGLDTGPDGIPFSPETMLINPDLVPLFVDAMALGLIPPSDGVGDDDGDLSMTYLERLCIATGQEEFICRQRYGR